MGKIWYAACFTEEDGIYSCDHNHPTVAEAVECLVPDGGGFVRAFDAGIFRALNEGEYIDFLEQRERSSSSLRHRKSS